MSRERLRAFIDLNRLHGTSFTIGIFLIGVISGMSIPSFSTFLIAIIIIFFLKTSVSVLNELIDFDMDSLDPVLQNKPIQLGLIKKREAWIYFVLCFISGLTLSILYFTSIATIILILILGLGYFYNIWGKYIPIAFDFIFSISMLLLVISGSYVSSGPTQLTILLGFITFGAGLIAQWINSLRDIDCDRVAKVGSIAVLDMFDPKDIQKKTSITFVYGYIIIGIYTFSLIWPFILLVVSFVYLPFVLMIYLISIILLFKWLFKASSKRDFNKIFVYQLVPFWLLIMIFLIDQVGWSASLGLITFVFIGTLLAIALEKDTQYKIAFSEHGTEQTVAQEKVI